MSWLIYIHNCSPGNHKFFFVGPTESLNVAFQPKAKCQNYSPDIIQTMTLKQDITYQVTLQQNDCDEPFNELGNTRNFNIIGLICAPVWLLCLLPGNYFEQVCFPVGLIGTFCLFWRYVYMRIHIKALLQTPFYACQQTYHLSDSRFSITGDQFEISADWSQFVQWGESKTAFCLFTSASQFYLLPHRCFTASELVEVRAHLTERVGKKFVERIGGVMLAIFIPMAILAICSSALSVTQTKFGTIQPKQLIIPAPRLGK